MSAIRSRDTKPELIVRKFLWQMSFRYRLKCQLKADKRQATLASLAFTLNHIYLQDHTVRYPRIEEEPSLDAAAEPMPKEANE